MKSERKPLHGWGMYPKSTANVFRPECVEDIQAIVAQGSLIARGLGRSYGDASLNSQHNAIDMLQMNKFLAFDPKTGVLHCEAGVSLVEIIQAFLPKGWFIPVTPGTKYVSMGGGVASDVHGKNHHKDGGFSDHLKEIGMVLADGSYVEASPRKKKDLFWATTGGMGLTGVVTDVKLKLIPVESNMVQYKNVQAKDLDGLLEAIEAYDDDYQYSVAWIDMTHNSKQMGRGVLMLANHAEFDELPAQHKVDPMTYVEKRKIQIPIKFPINTIYNFWVKWFNQLIYSRNSDKEGYQYLDPYFYPLDAILDWNRIYGPGGFTQYQFVVPEESARSALIEVFEEVKRYGQTSFVSVLKKLKDSKGLIAFSQKGYTLTLDFPITASLFGFLNRLDKIVLKYGGRVYLTKDVRLSPETFYSMYPNVTEWLEIKEKYDPDNIFVSDLSRRLGLEVQ